MDKSFFRNPWAKAFAALGVIIFIVILATSLYDKIKGDVVINNLKRLPIPNNDSPAEKEKAEKEARKKGAELAKAKAEDEAKAKAEAEAKAKEEAEAKAKEEAEAKAKEEAGEKGAELAKAKAEAKEEAKKKAQILAKKKDVTKFKPSSAEKYLLFVNARKSESKKPNTRYIWEVTNDQGTTLKQVYNLFSMKPVGCQGNRFFDIETGDNLSQFTIDSYSSTGVECHNPDSDFYDEIRKMRNKLDPDSLEIIYYMYQDIADYFNYKAETAVQCLISNGKLPDQKKMRDNLLVFGRVFNIKQPGEQGQVGLFLPVRVKYRNPDSGQITFFDVPTECFSDHQDIKLMMDENLL